MNFDAEHSDVVALLIPLFKPRLRQIAKVSTSTEDMVERMAEELASYVIAEMSPSRLRRAQAKARRMGNG